MSSYAALMNAQLESERAPTRSDESCPQCEILHGLECTHLTAQQIASLRPAYKNRQGDDGDATATIQIYECGHAYRNHRRVSHRAEGTRNHKNGFCWECWNRIVWGRTRMGRSWGATRPRNIARKSTVDTPKTTRPSGKVKVWRVRGPMVGKVKLR
ncbi:hypothetical protein F4779DRAFT_616490 [Xylariaceae sp. FL0662B]|nr:hypothetical protein F4779DRAFT_616490 [Xylariaceae sp. FL0662B]